EDGFRIVRIARFWRPRNTWLAWSQNRSGTHARTFSTNRRMLWLRRQVATHIRPRFLARSYPPGLPPERPSEGNPPPSCAFRSVPLRSKVGSQRLPKHTFPGLCHESEGRRAVGPT